MTHIKLSPLPIYKSINENKWGASSSVLAEATKRGVLDTSWEQTAKLFQPPLFVQLESYDEVVSALLHGYRISTEGIE